MGVHRPDVRFAIDTDGEANVNHSIPLMTDLLSNRQVAGVRLTTAELARGSRLGLIDAAQVVRIAERALAEDASQGKALEKLGLLLQDDLDCVESLVATIKASPQEDGDDPSRVWLYLCLQGTYDRRGSTAGSMSELERLYADFGYPEEMEGFVPFFPAPAGQPLGREALKDRWVAYLAARRAEFTRRGEN